MITHSTSNMSSRLHLLWIKKIFKGIVARGAFNELGALVEVNPFFFVEYISRLAMKIFEIRMDRLTHKPIYRKVPSKSVMDLSNIAITLETSGPRLLKEYFLTN